MKSEGFTLIELLIVVTIIAILYVIAVPNFMEDQMRSKVSRVHADMRMVSVAMHAYTVDRKCHPIPVMDAGPWSDPRIPGGEAYYAPNVWGGCFSSLLKTPGFLHGGCGHMLTSPVAYISVIPTDPFQQRGATPPSAYGFNYCGALPTAGLTFVGPFDGWPRSVPCKWWMNSLGPNRGRTPTSAIYDPTNGAVSAGIIIYFDTVGYLGK